MTALFDFTAAGEPAARIRKDADMARKKTVDSVIADAERLAQVWAENPKFSMGDLTLDKLRADMTELHNKRLARDEARTNLSKLVDDTNDQMKLVESYI